MQLWHWVYFSSGVEVTCTAPLPTRSTAPKGAVSSRRLTTSEDNNSNSDGQAQSRSKYVMSKPRLGLLFSRVPLAGPVYLCILALTTVLVTCTWTLVVTDWTTDDVSYTSTNATGLPKLGGFLVLEIVCCCAFAACVLNLLRLCCR